MRSKELGFTLIEILIVIGILSILATATVLILNPSEYLARSRDAVRISDLDTTSKALGLAIVSNSDRSLGFPNTCRGESEQTVYVSIPLEDPVPSDAYPGWRIKQVPEEDLRKVTGEGWLPVDFTDPPPSFLTKLPVDPINTYASGKYYTYVCGSFELGAAMESKKYLEKAAGDGGDDPTVYETGSDLENTPIRLEDVLVITSIPETEVDPLISPSSEPSLLDRFFNLFKREDAIVEAPLPDEEIILTGTPLPQTPIEYSLPIAENIKTVNNQPVPETRVVKYKSKIPVQIISAIDSKDKDIKPVFFLPYPEITLSKIDVALSNITDLLSDNRYVSDKYTIKVIAQVPKAVSLDQAESVIGLILGKLPNSKIIKRLNIVHSLVIEIDMGYIDNLALSSVVKKLWLNRFVQTNLNVSIPLINADDVWAKTDTLGNQVKGQGIKIAIVDTGVDYTHADLGSCTSATFNAGNCAKVTKGKDFINNDNDPMDDYGHGTHVAATAGGTGQATSGQYTGVAPEAEIWGVKVLSASGSGTWDQVISGIEWSTDPNGDGVFTDRADIMSLSLGGGCSPCDGTDLVSQAIDNAFDRGTLAVVAAGNSGGTESTVGTPGVAKKALTVGASDDADALASFSSKGPTSDFRIKPDITAPGVAICAAQWGTWLGSYQCGPSDTHISISGTSMATPHVSGAAALIKQLHPTWTPQEIKSVLILGAKDINLKVNYQGSGRMDVLKASEIPFVISETPLNFGRVTSAGPHAKIVRLTNVLNTELSVSLSPGSAIRQEDQTTHSILSANPNAITIQPNSFTDISLSANLGDLTGAFEGTVSINASGKTYRLPYSILRKSVIRFSVKDPSGNPISNYAILTDNNFNQLSISSSAKTEHTFMVDAGQYNVFGFTFRNDAWSHNVMKEVAIGVDEDILSEVSLSSAVLHTFESKTKNGNLIYPTQYAMNGIGVKNKWTVFLSGGPTYRASYTTYIKDMDLSGKGYVGLVSNRFDGTHDPKCDSNSQVNIYCAPASLSAPDFYYAAKTVENPNSGEASHLWTPATDSIGARKISMGTHTTYQDSENVLWHSDPYICSIFGCGGGVGWRSLAGRNQDVYFSSGLSLNRLLFWDKAVGGRNDIMTEVFAMGSHVSVLDPTVDGSTSDSPFFGKYESTPLSIGRLITNRTNLESTDYWLKVNNTYICPNSWNNDCKNTGPIPPYIEVYKNGSLVQSSNKAPGWTNALVWAKNIYGSGYYSFNHQITSGEYRVVLSIPNAGQGGEIIQTYHFSEPSGDRSTPYIQSMIYPKYIGSSSEYYLTINTADDVDSVQSVQVLYRQDNADLWVEAGIVSGTPSTYKAVLNKDTPIQVKVVLEDTHNNIVGYEFKKLAAKGIPLNPIISYNATSKELTGTLSGDCYDCANIVVRVLCGETLFRNWYFLSGYMGKIDNIYNTGTPLLVDCGAEQLKVEFVGAGPLMPFLWLYVDTDPPAGTISINSGASYTNTTSVNLTPSCSDSGSGCSQMRFSNDNTTFSTWETFSTSKSWTLTPGDGTRTVYVKYKDNAGNITEATISDSIVLDTIAPTGTISINSGAQYTNSTSVTLTLSCTDATSGCSQMQFSNDDSTYSAFETYSTSKVWTLTTGDGTKTVYVKYKDSAGNISSAINDTIILDTIAPEEAFILINNDASFVNMRSVDLDLYCSDSNSGVKDVRYANEDKTWTSWGSYQTSKSWTLTAGDGAKTVYYQCRDNALNVVEKLDTIILDSTVDTITITKPLYYYAYVANIGEVDLDTLGDLVKKPTIVGPITIKATVSNIGSPVAKVEFFINNQLRNTDTSVPYQWTWTPSLPTELGDRTITVKSTDYVGNVASQSIVVQVVPTGQ